MVSKGQGPDLAKRRGKGEKRIEKKRLLQTASKALGPDFANFCYFHIKRPFTKSLEGPGPRFCQF